MTRTTSLLKLLPVLALGALLAACDSGSVGTTANPDLNVSGSKFVYTGPAARNIDVSNFQYYLWRNVIDDTRCGGCHNSAAGSPQMPFFFDTNNINVAYDQAITRVDLVNPLNSALVDKLNNGHFCWESVSAICGTLIAGWIEDWKNASNGGVASRQINLTPPSSIRPPGEAKSFPATAFDTGTNGTSFANTVWPLLVGTNPLIANDNCQNCHEEIATPLPQAPFFASGDIAAAYEAAKAKMDIDTPANSRFVQRLLEGHNCWSNCGTDQFEAGTNARLMRDRIASFAAGIDPTPVDSSLNTSMALKLTEGIVASGGNRHETDQFALWEFKTGTGNTAFDTSGLDPAVNLSLIGGVTWVGGYGLEFSGGRAQADTINSDKIYTYINDTGKYAIEAWVIPANVSQEDANIVSYSGGDTSRNFTLGQDMYDYEAFNRIDTPQSGLNGTPFLSTQDSGMEIAQASLQHVVINFDPFDLVNPGRSIYVNGQRIAANDSVLPTIPIDDVWDDGYAFILGNEISGNRPWAGQVKMVALHNQPLTPAQIQQNFDVGVGQKFFLLFWVGQHLGETISNPLSFIMFEVAQFDSYSYLFNKPTFVNLDPLWTPTSTIEIEGLRIGINGKEAVAGQAYAHLDVDVDGVSYNPSTGQELSSVGTVIALEKGSDSDEFFLTFERIGNAPPNPFTEATPLIPADPLDPSSPVESDIGMRTFEEINTTIAAITGVPVTNGAVSSVYDDYIQQLPSTEAIGAFLSSHQMAIAQLALTSCSELVEGNGDISRASYFPGFAFNAGAQSAFDTPAKRAQIIDPLLTAAMNADQAVPANNLTSQPDETDIHDLLGSTATQDLDPALSSDAYESLITELVNSCTPVPPATTCTPPDTVARTAQIVKAVCAVAAGGAVMLVQ